ncbi:hypothetical protein PRZ48_005420 [Zasmidium cellare]|uniref:Uncharacterized protein n=1 Tax=Zasmidium cellare TaxID=395010 RepID=A0ABR0ESC5_ZASCE|nr:hypothetical protein PRZ48_005420 [Zasmidium cellare]
MKINKLTQVLALAAVTTAQNLAYTTVSFIAPSTATKSTASTDVSTIAHQEWNSRRYLVSKDGSAVATYPIGSAATSYIPNTDATVSGSSSMTSDNASFVPAIVYRLNDDEFHYRLDNDDFYHRSSASSPTSTASAASQSNAGSAVNPLAAMGGIMGMGLAAMAMI